MSLSLPISPLLDTMQTTRSAPRTLSSPLPKSTPSRSPATKRTASSPPTVQPLHLHSWADSWSNGFSKAPSKLGGASAASGSTIAFDASHSPASGDGVWRWEKAWAGQGDVEEKEKALVDVKEESWIETADLDGSFLLDGPASVRPRLDRANSLELDFGSLSAPSFHATSLGYPSPCSPGSFSASDSYFPLQPLPTSTDEPTLPPSPALVPFTLSKPPAFSPAPPSPAPRAQPAATHPLHRAKRLSMTPLSSASAALHSSPRAAPPPQVRKKSIVDLPTPIIGGEAPLTPPTTPIEGGLQLQEEKREERRHPSDLATERSARAMRMPAVAVSPKRQRHT